MAFSEIGVPSLQVHHSDEVPDYDPMAGVRGGTTDQFADWATTVIPGEYQQLCTASEIS